MGLCEKTKPVIGLPKSDKNATRLENTLQNVIQENFLNVARQANIQIQEIKRAPLKYSRRATPRHIIIRFSNVKTKKKLLKEARERSGHLQRETHQTNSRSLCRNPISQKRVEANI